MNDSIYFYAWVANTVAKCGGNAGQYLQGLQEECALTSMAKRMPACQGGLSVFFKKELSTFKPCEVIATTNLMWIH